MKRNRMSLGLVVLGIVLFTGASLGLPPIAAPAEKLQLLMGSTQMVSSYYPPSVALAGIINKNVPQAQVTVVESGATYDNLARSRIGEFHLSMPSGYPGIIESYYGTGRFKDKPDKTIRMLFVEACSVVYVAVRTDSGITDMQGLHGKKFYPGPTGHISTRIVQKALEDSGIKANYFIGGFSDAITAAKDNRIVGFAKFAAGTQLDASMIDFKERTPVRLLSFTEKQLDYIVRNFPGNEAVVVPKGRIKGLPDEGPLGSFLSCVACWTTNKLPEPIAYGIVKAACENWGDIVATLPIAREIDPVANSVKHFSSTKPIPLHPGAIRYFQDKGVAVPKNLIPPEDQK